MAAASDWAEICKHQFSLLDADGSGYIDEHELHEVFKQLDEEWSWERSKQLFRAMDAKADGRVDYEELVDWVAGVADHEEVTVSSLDKTLGDLRQLAASWEAQIGKPVAPRRAVSGDFKTDPLEPAEQLTLTVVTLSGKNVELNGLKHAQPLGDVFALVASAFDAAPFTFSLLLKDQALGPCDAETSLASLGIVGGSAQLTCAFLSEAVLADGCINDYEVRDAIKSCEYCGCDRLARHKRIGAFYSLRILPKALLCRYRRVPYVYQEKKILQSMRHPFIMELHGSFQDPLNLYLVIEHGGGGELLTQLQKHRKFSNETSKFYLAIVVLAIEYLHSQSVMFRNLKPENLIITKDGYLKLRDFCDAKRLEHGDRTFTQKCAPEYAAPEVLLDSGHSHAVDIWTLGVLAYEMSVGEPPFTHDDIIRIYQRVLLAKVYFPRYVSMQLKRLIKNCLTRDLQKRWAIDAIRSSSFFEDLEWTLLCDSQLPAPWVPELEGDGDLRYFSPVEEPAPAAEYVPKGQDPFAAW